MPFEKSYSGRISASADLVDVLFIIFPFAPAGAPGADDANSIASFGVNDNQQFLFVGMPQNDGTGFRLGMRRVWNCEGKRIAENSRRFFKAHAMFSKVYFCFVFVPFKIKHDLKRTFNSWRHGLQHQSLIGHISLASAFLFGVPTPHGSGSSPLPAAGIRR